MVADCICFSHFVHTWILFLANIFCLNTSNHISFDTQPIRSKVSTWGWYRRPQKRRHRTLQSSAVIHVFQQSINYFHRTNELRYCKWYTLPEDEFHHLPVPNPYIRDILQSSALVRNLTSLALRRRLVQLWNWDLGIRWISIFHHVRDVFFNKGDDTPTNDFCCQQILLYLSSLIKDHTPFCMWNSQLLVLNLVRFDIPQYSEVAGKRYIGARNM